MFKKYNLVWGTYTLYNENCSSNWHLLVLKRVLRFVRMLCGIYVPSKVLTQNGDLTNLLKSARKKVPQSARLSAGEGVQSLFGQCLTYMWCCNLWCVTQVWLRLGMWRMAEGGVAEVWHTEIPTINTPRHQDTKTPRYQEPKVNRKGPLRYL